MLAVLNSILRDTRLYLGTTRTIPSNTGKGALFDNRNKIRVRCLHTFSYTIKIVIFKNKHTHKQTFSDGKIQTNLRN